MPPLDSLVWNTSAVYATLVGLPVEVSIRTDLESPTATDAIDLESSQNGLRVYGENDAGIADRKHGAVDRIRIDAIFQEEEIDPALRRLAAEVKDRLEMLGLHTIVALQ